MNKTVMTLQLLIIESGIALKGGADGIYGKETAKSIDNMCFPNWIKTAMKEIGVKEILGKRNSERVLDYHEVSGGYSEDSVPWCGSFVNWVMVMNDIETVKIPARAKSWLNFGVSSIMPVIGSIAVKSRSGGGHVCFVVGKNEGGDLYCLGGNQNDEVNIKIYKKEVFIDFRIPQGYTGRGLRKYALNTSSSSREA